MVTGSINLLDAFIKQSELKSNTEIIFKKTFFYKMFQGPKGYIAQMCEVYNEENEIIDFSIDLLTNLF